MFWNLLELAFPDELAAGMRSMMSAMEVLGGLKSGTHAEKVYAWYQKYYLNVKEYFPAVTVNEDSKRYENAKLMMNAGRYTNDTDPLTQELGDLYSAETAWMKKRIQYMSSKYSFGEYSANGTDSINVRAAGNAIAYDIIPAIDMYPTIANGTSIVKGSRTKAGQVCRMIIDLGGTGDQQNIIQGASWLMSIGKWHDKNVNGNLIIKGRMLRELELGSRTERIVIAITGLTISDCVSLQSILLSNIATLAGSLDLSVCTHLRRVWADGTSLTQIRLPQGGCLELVQYPSTNRYLTLQNFPLLKQEGVLIDDCAGKITDFFVSDCPKLNPVDLLIKIMDAQQEQGEAHALKRVRAVFGEYTYNENGAEMLDNLGKLADGTYVGLNSSGVAGDDPRSVLDGTLHINTNCYEDTAIALRSYFNRLVLNITGEFYLRFKDDFVGSYMVGNYGDGTGIIKAQLANITDSQFGTPFSNNTQIMYFDEFQYMTSISMIKPGLLKYCSNLKSFILPPYVTEIAFEAFRGTAIEEMTIPKYVEHIQQAIFSGCPNLKKVEFESGRMKPLKLRWSIFEKCGSLESFKFPDEIVSEGMDNFFDYCSSLKTVILPVNGLTLLGKLMFRGCNVLTGLEVPASVTSFGNDLFYDCKSMIYLKISSSVPPACSSANLGYGFNAACKIYVPDDSVETYKGNSWWSQYSSRIYPLSSYNE